MFPFTLFKFSVRFSQFDKMIQFQFNKEKKMEKMEKNEVKIASNHDRFMILKAIIIARMKSKSIP